MRRFLSKLAVVSVGLVLCSCGGLLYNAKIGNIDNMEAALENGVSIEKQNDAGSTALIIAAYSDQPEAVAYLCKKGANVNAQNKNGVTALHHAAYYNLYEVAEILVTYHADSTIRDRYGNTPLNYAEQYGYTRIVDLLTNK